MIHPPKIIHKGWRVNCTIAFYIVLSISLIFGVMWIIDPHVDYAIIRFTKENTWPLKAITLVAGLILQLPIYLWIKHLKNRQTIIDDSYPTMLKKRYESSLTKEAEWIVQQFITKNHVKVFEMLSEEIHPNFSISELQQRFDYPDTVTFPPPKCIIDITEKREVFASIFIDIEDNEGFIDDITITFSFTLNQFKLCEIL